MKYRRPISQILISILLITGLSVAPVFANHGSGDQSSDNTTTSDNETTVSPTTTSGSNESSHRSSSESSDLQKIKNESEIKTENEVHDQIEIRGGELLNELEKDGAKKHTDQERKNNCLSAEHGLETKLGNLGKNATRFQTKLDTALSMALDFQKTNNLNPANFTDLVTKANAAKTKSAASVTVLNGLSSTINCSSTTVATDVANFKAATEQARTDLLAYKATVKAILMSLETAKGDN